jgi:hypothetical protein
VSSSSPPVLSFFLKLYLHRGEVFVSGLFPYKTQLSGAAALQLSVAEDVVDGAEEVLVSLLSLL